MDILKDKETFTMLHGFTYHVFTAPGTFTVSASNSTGDAGVII